MLIFLHLLAVYSSLSLKKDYYRYASRQYYLLVNNFVRGHELRKSLVVNSETLVDYL